MPSVAPVAPPRWTDDDFERERLAAIDIFRRQRMQEPLEAFLEIFDERLGHVEDLLEATTDLTRLDESALAVLSDPNLSEVFRYLTGPPISLDDLKTVADVSSVVASRLREAPDAVQRLIETIRFGLDRRRFPWVPDEREPTEAERTAAGIATAALIAVQRLATSRRNEGKTEQERRVIEALRVAGFTQVATRSRLGGAGW